VGADLWKKMAGEQSFLQEPCAYTEIKVDLAGYKVQVGI
jgi:hypothetical protein